MTQSAPKIAGVGAKAAEGDLRRILVIDDNPAIVRDFRKLLCPEPTAALDDLESALFGTSSTSEAQVTTFVVESAPQGKDGLDMVRRMQRAGSPYAMAFVDMRMPPGWDGIETLERIWAEFPALEAVICSAYSEYSWHEVIKRLPRPGLRLLSKPFETKDVLELVWSLTTRWRKKNM